MPEEVQTFFQGFNFDTLLALISCLTGIIALFLGGAAYKNCRKFKKSFNDKKKFGDNGIDQSVKAGGDVTYNSCDTNALVSLTTENFKVCLQQTYDMFEQKTNENLYKIIDEANRIVQTGKIQLGAYTKIDWINIYFENAKNASDKYMQSVWAKVLANELQTPGSFSYKTLDILKNMSEDDFRLFEKMCSLAIDDYLLEENIYDKYELPWISKVRLKEFGLLSLEATERTLTLQPDNTHSQLYNNRYLLLMKNTTSNTINYCLQIHLLTSSAVELKKIAKLTANKNFIIDYAKEVIKNNMSGLTISLHLVNEINHENISYHITNLLENEGV